MQSQGVVVVDYFAVEEDGLWATLACRVNMSGESCSRILFVTYENKDAAFKIDGVLIFMF